MKQSVYIRLQIAVAVLILILWGAMWVKVIILSQPLSQPEVIFEQCLRAVILAMLSISALSRAIQRENDVPSSPPEEMKNDQS